MEAIREQLRDGVRDTLTTVNREVKKATSRKALDFSEQETTTQTGEDGEEVRVPVYVKEATEDLVEDCVRRNTTPRIVRECLEQGADPNARTQTGWPVLQLLCKKGFIEGVEMLLEAGADVDALNAQTQTALWIVSDSKIEDFVKLAQVLIDAGASVNARDPSGHTCLVNAVFQKNLPMVKLLLRHDARINRFGPTQDEHMSAHRIAKWILAETFLLDPDRLPPEVLPQLPPCGELSWRQRWEWTVEEKIYAFVDAAYRRELDILRRGGSLSVANLRSTMADGGNAPAPSLPPLQLRQLQQPEAGDAVPETDPDKAKHRRQRRHRAQRKRQADDRRNRLRQAKEEAQKSAYDAWKRSIAERVEAEWEQSILERSAKSKALASTFGGPNGAVVPIGLAATGYGPKDDDGNPIGLAETTKLTAGEGEWVQDKYGSWQQKVVHKPLYAPLRRNMSKIYPEHEHEPAPAPAAAAGAATANNGSTG